jgi:PAS domain S-box-containing protein
MRRGPFSPAGTGRSSVQGWSAEIQVNALAPSPETPSAASREEFRLHRGMQVLLIAVVHYAGLQVGLLLRFPPDDVAAIYPPVAVILAVLVLTSPRTWLLCMLAMLPTQVIAQSQGGRPVLSVGFLAAAWVTHLPAALVLRRLGGGRPRLDTLGQLQLFVVLALGAAALYATVGTVFQAASRGSEDLWLTWRVRCLASALAHLSITPAILKTAREGGWRRLLSAPRARSAEAALLALGLVAVGISLGKVSVAPVYLPGWLYAPLPLLLWAAVRFGLGGLSWSLLAVTLLLSFDAVASAGPFAAHPASDHVLSLQIFLFAVSLPLMVVATLVGERRQAETALREAQVRHRQATMAGGVGVWDWDLETDDIYVDPALKAILGYDDHEIRNRIGDWGRLVHPEDAERVMAEARAHLDGATPCYEVEHRMLHRDGSVRWFLARGVVVARRPDGRPLRMSGTDTDITERRQAMAEQSRLAVAVERERRRVSAIVATVPGVVWEAWRDDAPGDDVDPARPRTTFVSEYVEPMAGYSMDEWLRTPDFWLSIVHPDDRERVAREGTAIFAAGQGGIVQCRWIRKDGRVIWVEGHFAVVRDERGRPVGMRGVTMDITERRQAEDALRKSTAMIRHLAGCLLIAQEEERRRIARELHDDLNQKVAALSIGISRIKRQQPPAALGLLCDLDTLRERTGELAHTIRALSHELHPAALEHAGLVAALRSFVAEFSRREEIAIAFEATGQPDSVPPDVAICIYRVAQEAVRNVAKHSGARRAELTLTVGETAVTLAVTDKGRGFDLPSARRGAGLGLISIEERVRALRGRLQISALPGQGAALLVEIPLLASVTRSGARP